MPEALPMTGKACEKKDVCGVVVTYHPGDGLEERVEALSRQVERVVIVDNGSSGERTPVLDRLQRRPSVCLIRNGRNLGVATALNEGLEWAREHGFGWAFLFDQDSALDEGALDALIAIMGAYDGGKPLAVVGCNYRDVNSGRLRYPDESVAGVSWRERKTVITSGSLVSVAVFGEIGPFRDAFFIDHVDDEYCLRARRRGFAVISTCRPVMRHRVGAATLHRLLWKRTGTTNHPPFRRYYMTRNHIILIGEYWTVEPRWVYDTVYSRLKSFVLMCLFERQRAAKMRYMLKGFAHGVLRRERSRA
jgi:rhamnosyltransferase